MRGTAKVPPLAVPRSMMLLGLLLFPLGLLLLLLLPIVDKEKPRVRWDR